MKEIKFYDIVNVLEAIKAIEHAKGNREEFIAAYRFLRISNRLHDQHEMKNERRRFARNLKTVINRNLMHQISHNAVGRSYVAKCNIF